jgi:hypothetical protein
MTGRACSVIASMAVFLSCGVVIRAHSGPPFPIVSNRIVGAYDISIWTDPDSTDDKTPAGRFWIVLEPASHNGTVPAGTHVMVAVHALDRPGPIVAGQAEPSEGLLSRQFVALLMDHEGPFGVKVTVEGPLGHAELESQVDATYDLRPSPYLLAVFLFPFVAVGALWVKVLRRRRK